MNRAELISHIEAIKSEEQISFYIDGEKVESRFDEKETPLEKGDYSTDLALLLYGWIGNAIFLKASGRERAQAGYLDFENYLKESLNKTEADDETTKNYHRALSVLKRFLFRKEKIIMGDLFEEFFPFAKQVSLLLHPEEEKEITHISEKEKMVIFNEAALFTRSLYHTLLTRADASEARKTKLDKGNYANGVFLYDSEVLFLPAWQDAFTLTKFKEVALKDIETISPLLPLEEVKEISLIYFGKDIVANAEII